MSKSTVGKFTFWRSVLSNPISKGVISLFRNPISILYIGLFVFVVLINIEHSFSDAPKQTGYFSGSIEFDNNPAYSINTHNIKVHVTKSGDENIIEITAINQRDSNTVYTRIKNFKGVGTYFIPGEGTTANVGNLIKDVKDYQNINNFYEATRPNSAGISNGVGRVNITSYSENSISGDLVLIGNNPAGQQAILGAAKFNVTQNASWK
jgi:hypothetical protein